MHLPKDRRGWIKLVVVLVALYAAYRLVTALIPDIDVEQLLDDISESLGKWTYAIVALLAFLETGAFVGLVAPGETFVVLAGAVAGRGETSVVLTIAIVWTAAFLGDLCSYLIGKRLGRDFILRHGERMRISRERFAQVESYFDRHGGKTILIGRFIGLVRALAPFIAGSSGMRYRAMAPYSILGTGLWASAFTLLGYFASQQVEQVLSASETGLKYFFVLVVLIVLVVNLVRYLRVEENRERVVAWMEGRAGTRWMVALGRRLAPQARFLWKRLTPGGLGLELTAPLAAAAVGGFVFVAYALTFADDPGPTPGDTTAFDIAGDLSAGWLTSVAKVVTELGTRPILIAVTFVALFALAYGRHWFELIVLAIASLLLLFAVPEFKDMVARPRPPDGLVDAPSYSYPSGHAAHAVIYAWLAITVAIRIRPGWRWGTALIVGGVLLTVAIGLTRVYLHVHYLSDVTGGWGLGTAIFTLVASIALVTRHVRQAGDSGPPTGDPPHTAQSPP